MQTTIYKKIDQKIIEQIFDAAKINIRYYRPTKKGFYSVDIRHGEDEDPNILFNKELNKISNLKN